MSTVLASVRVFGQLDGVDLSKGREELPNVLLAQGCQVADQTTDVDSVVLLTLLVLVPWGQRVAKRWDLRLFHSTRINRCIN